jgi:hypothetical protein
MGCVHGKVKTKWLYWLERISLEVLSRLFTTGLDYGLLHTTSLYCFD